MACPRLSMCVLQIQLLYVSVSQGFPCLSGWHLGSCSNEACALFVVCRTFILACSSCRIMLHEQNSCFFWNASHICSLPSIPLKFGCRALYCQLWKTEPCCCCCSPAISAFRSESVTLYFSWRVQKSKQHEMSSYLHSRLLVVVTCLSFVWRIWGEQEAEAGKSGLGG